MQRAADFPARGNALVGSLIVLWVIPPLSNTESVNPCVFFSGGLRTGGVYFYQPCTIYIIQLLDFC